MNYVYIDKLGVKLVSQKLYILVWCQFIGACKQPVMVIVTELLLGGTLRKYLWSIRPKCLDLHMAVGFALDIAQAMECLHSHGIIHRDLKPGIPTRMSNWSISLSFRCILEKTETWLEFLLNFATCIQVCLLHLWGCCSW